ncbi:MAG TPA: hypothetical protein VNV36_06090 [Pseudomonas sp.]|uniref:hypothetical protein n=1 Tax=Pseudomonas sp. TaxID=306 RepID=UPI002B588387|nr:hypothetical protein [Pseudomonas sp.]HWH86327.1 hypothetical protein [Pseudomonas sp.]
MTQEDWDALKAQMDQPWGQMKLQCDQFELLLVQSASVRRRCWETIVYVGGFMRTEWMQVDGDGQALHEEARRFMRKVVRPLYSAREVEGIRNTYGKRRATESKAKKFVIFDCAWKNFNSLKKHLLANNTSITRIVEA